MYVTRDDIRTYTAGVVMVLDQQINTRLEGETVVIHADLTAQVDSHEVTQAITALQENETAKLEMLALRTEVDQLHQQLDATNAVRIGGRLVVANAPTPSAIEKACRHVAHGIGIHCRSWCGRAA